MKSTTQSTRRAKKSRKPSSKPNQPPKQQQLANVPRSPPNRELISQVCGITDPFCPHAVGAKYPDASSVRTLPYTRKLRYVLSTDASGYANIFINPQYSYYPYSTNNVYTGNTITSWNHFTSYSTIAGVHGYRIVSAGYILRHIVSPLNSAGMVHIRQYGTENCALLAPLDTTTYNATSAVSVAVQDLKETAVVLQRTSQMPQTFYLQSTDTQIMGNSTTHGFATSTVAISGAPANTAILEIEFFINFELIFDDGSDLAQVATPPPPSNAVVSMAASRVTSTIVPIVEGGVAAFGKIVVSKAASALAGYLFGPPGALATRSALAITVD